MMISVRVILLSGLAALFVVCACEEAAAYRGHRSSYNSAAASRARQQQVIQAASAQLAAAKQVLAAAESTGSDAKAKIDEAVSKLKEKSQEFHDAQSNTRHLVKEVADIEKEILEEQKPDSPYGKAVAEVEAARKQFRDVETRIMEESEVQSAPAGLSGAKLAQQKSTLVGLRPEYLQAKSRLDAAATDVDRIRRELFRADKDWKETADALTQARKDEKEAHEKTHVGTQGRVGNMQKLQSAEEVKAAAKMAIAQAEAMLRAAGGSKYITASNSPGNQQPQKKK